MPRGRGGKREQIRAQGQLVGCAVGPKSAAEVPVFPETALMRHSILNDERLNALRVSKSQAKANWPTIVLHVEAVMCQAERPGHMLHHGRNVVEGVRELGMIRPIAMAETRIIRSDQVIAVGQALQKRLIHPRRGWQAVKQKQGRGVRSEEHTSELQSHLNLVCRLLLEKKKDKLDGTTRQTTLAMRPAPNPCVISQLRTHAVPTRLTSVPTTRE